MAEPDSLQRITRAIVTGDLDWECRPIAREIVARLKRYGDVVLIHGHASGVDSSFAAEAGPAGVVSHVFTADWDKLGNKAGPVRNEWMVRTGADLVIAVCRDISKSNRTRDCVCRALKAGIPVMVIESDESPGKWENLSMSAADDLGCRACLQVDEELVKISEIPDINVLPEPTPSGAIPAVQDPGLPWTQSEGPAPIDGSLTFWKWMQQTIADANAEFSDRFDGQALGADIKIAVKSVVHSMREIDKHNRDPDKKRTAGQWAILVNEISKGGDNRQWMEEYLMSHVKTLWERKMAEIRG